MLGGRYETTTDVQAFLNLALDTALMKETSDLDTKKDLYKHVSFVLIHSRINPSLSAASFFFSHRRFDSFNHTNRRGVKGAMSLSEASV